MAGGSVMGDGLGLWVLGSLRGGSHGGIRLGWEGVNGLGVKKTEGREVDWSGVKGFDLFSRALQIFDVGERYFAKSFD
ncbi:hypothetical protein ACE6H2_000611 [Prunus campanulata]